MSLSLSISPLLLSDYRFLQREIIDQLYWPLCFPGEFPLSTIRNETTHPVTTHAK